MADTTVRIDGNTLRLPGGVTVRFIRTLRLPETGTHPLPPGLGEFPVRRVADYADRVPEAWRARGGVMLPVYLREAMWLSFAGTSEPAALQVGVGKVCAVSGRPWSDRPARGPQNYVVLPRQPWLDGINSGTGTVRQFVAVPLGLGATVEGQVTGEEVWGGVQLQSFPLNDRELARWHEEERRQSERTRGISPSGGYGAAMPGGYGAAMPMAAPPAPGAAPAPPAYGAAPAPAAGAAPSAPPRAPAAMGLGVGGSMRQEVYQDDRPLSDWARAAGGAGLRAPGDAAGVAPHHRRGATAVAGGPGRVHPRGPALVRLLRPGRAGPGPHGHAPGRQAGRRLARATTTSPGMQPAPGQVRRLKDAPGKPVEDGDW